jgi:FMN-dependent NADH-azoreductase
MIVDLTSVCTVGNKSAKEFIEKAKENDVIELDLSHKKIAELPDSIGDLKSLIKARPNETTNDDKEKKNSFSPFCDVFLTSTCAAQLGWQ